MTGDFRGGNSPSITCKSVRHTPQQWMRTNTSSGPGCGTGTSVNSSGFVSMFAGFRSRQAFIGRFRKSAWILNVKRNPKCRQSSTAKTEQRVLSGFSGSQALPLHGLPRHVSPQILPQTLQAPDHVQLTVGKMLEKTAADESRHILPIVIALVGDLFL